MDYHLPILIGFSAVLGFCTFPLIYAEYAAYFYGCRTHEGYPEVCMIDGVDVGPSLHSMMVAMWLLIFPAFVAFLGVIFTIISWICHVLIRKITKLRKA